MCSRPLDVLGDWIAAPFGGYFIYRHPDLDGAIAPPDNGAQIGILGRVYDPFHPDRGLHEILADLAACVPNRLELLSALKRFTGRYVVIYRDSRGTIVVPDALALREVYYCENVSRVLCASQPNLLAALSDPVIGPTRSQDVLAFYQRHLKSGRWDPACKWVGDQTLFEGVRHLLPNHYLEIEKRRAQRFWPAAPVRKLELKAAVSQACEFLEGSLRAMTRQHPLMMAITAGTDSRTLLAASKGIVDRVYWFINDEQLGPHHPDIAVPRSMCACLGIDLHVHEVPNEVPEDFRKIFLENTFFATERVLSTIYHVYFKRLPHRTNILGIGEIGRTRFGPEPRLLDGFRLAYKLGLGDDPYACSVCADILDGMREVYRQCGVNIMTGFYWEQMLGNWGATGNSESDIAIEEVNPCNSHRFYEVLLGVHPRCTTYHRNRLFRQMISHMWPELLEWPINPPHTPRGHLLAMLQRLGILPLAKELKYRLASTRRSARAGMGLRQAPALRS